MGKELICKKLIRNRMYLLVVDFKTVQTRGQEYRFDEEILRQ